MNDENYKIQEAIKFFKYGKFSEKKKYISELYSNGTSFNGFTFVKDSWCWIIWKPTDIAKNPEYKGEPLCKVIPDTVPITNIFKVLDAQPWTYI